MKRHRGVMLFLLSGLAAAMVASDSLGAGKPGIVRTRDGQTYIGEIDDSGAESVSVTARGISTAVPRDRIASVEYSEDFEKSFRERLGKLPADDVSSRLALAREAYDRRQYFLAREAAAQAQQIDPNSADAADLLNVIQSQIRLERQQQQQQQQQPGGAAAGAGAPGAAPATQPAQPRLLSPQQINAIRQAELRPEDSGVRVRFDRDVKRRFMEYTSRTPQEINSMTVNDLVQKILSEGTPEMKRDVLILNDPPSMFQYRRMVQPFVLQNCATTGCHGVAATQAQKVSLIMPADSDAAAYTNFYILQNYRKKLDTGGDNIFGRGELRMIDRQAPEQSVLLQYGLPGAIAEWDHPDVPGFHPPYRGLNDPRYQQVRNWIGQSLVAVPPEYGFEFEPQPRAATQPATAPAEPAEAPPQTSPAAPPGVRPAAPRPLQPPAPRPAQPARPQPTR